MRAGVKRKMTPAARSFPKAVGEAFDGLGDGGSLAEDRIGVGKQERGVAASSVAHGGQRESLPQNPLPYPLRSTHTYQWQVHPAQFTPRNSYALAP